MIFYHYIDKKSNTKKMEEERIKMETDMNKLIAQAKAEL